MAAPTSKELLELLEKSIGAATQIAPNLRFSSRDASQLFAVALYCTLIEHADAIFALCQSDKSIVIPTVTRSALDAYIDIENLFRDRNYWRFLQAADDGEWNKILERTSRGGNPFLRKMEAVKNLSTARKERAAHVAAQRKAGYRKLQVKERYQRAGREFEYEAVYSFLSADAHNSISTVVQRHFDWSDASRPRLRAKAKPRFEASCVLTTAEALVRASELLLKVCGHGAAPISSARVALDHIDSQVGDSDGEETKPSEGDA